MSISKGSFNDSVIYKVFWSTCNSDYIWSSAQIMKMVLKRYFQSDHSHKLDVTNSPGKVCRFTTQQSRHKSATATVSCNSRKSIYIMLTGVTYHTHQDPHSRLAAALKSPHNAGIPAYRNPSRLKIKPCCWAYATNTHFTFSCLAYCDIVTISRLKVLTSLTSNHGLCLKFVSGAYSPDCNV